MPGAGDAEFLIYQYNCGHNGQTLQQYTECLNTLGYSKEGAKLPPPPPPVPTWPRAFAPLSKSFQQFAAEIQACKNYAIKNPDLDGRAPIQASYAGCLIVFMGDSVEFPDGRVVSFRDIMPALSASVPPAISGNNTHMLASSVPSQAENPNRKSGESNISPSASSGNKALDNADSPFVEKAIFSLFEIWVYYYLWEGKALKFVLSKWAEKMGEDIAVSAIGNVVCRDQTMLSEIDSQSHLFKEWLVWMLECK